MSYSTSARNTMLSAFVGVAGFAALHSAAPGPTGANEISGSGSGGPYTRVPVVWGAPAGGVVSTTVAPTALQWPSGVPLQYYSLWSAVTAGNFAGAFPLGGFTPTPFTAVTAGTFTSEDHGLSNGQTVVLIDTSGGNLPPGTAEETIYFVITATTDTFQLSATSGGAAITLTDDGVGFVCRNLIEAAPGAPGTYQLSSISADLLR